MEFRIDEVPVKKNTFADRLVNTIKSPIHTPLINTIKNLFLSFPIDYFDYSAYYLHFANRPVMHSVIYPAVLSYISFPLCFS